MLQFYVVIDLIVYGYILRSVFYNFCLNPPLNYSSQLNYSYRVHIIIHLHDFEIFRTSPHQGSVNNFSYNFIDTIGQF